MKRITITPLGPLQSHPGLRWSFAMCYRATSFRFGVTVYGRTVAEAKQRLFVTVMSEQRNRSAVIVAYKMSFY